jgi:uncharacterized protein (UPF0332 family)
MHGEDFLFPAEQLLKMPSEAAYRTAVNRAYYAVYHCGAEFLSGLGLKTSGGPQTHGQLQARVNNCGVAEFQQLYRIIHKLYDSRLLADYDLKSNEFQSQATTALWLVSAKQAIAIIKDCKKSQSLCNQIRQGIREYEAKIKA